ncbi:hypothetical protein V6O07_01670 [Arthrospira platensis SPKY2]
MPNLKIRWEDIINKPSLNSNFLGEINIWGNGNYSFCFVLNKEDGWYILPRKFPVLREIQNNTNNQYINTLGRDILSSDRSKEFKLKVVFNKNHKNVYNPLSTNWNDGKNNGCLWLKIFNNDINLLKTHLNIEETLIGLNNSITCVIDLPTEIVNFSNLDLAFGIFWDHEVDSWPLTNIRDDIIQNNNLQYGSLCEIAIEYISLYYYHL